MADNTKQHIVPRFYIAFFYADGQQVYVRMNGSDEIKLKSPKGQGYEKDAFTIVTDGERDTSCDDVNRFIENWCAPRLARLSANSPPTDEEWQAIFFLTANLISRSRWTRDNNVWKGERVRKSLPKLIEVLKDLPPLPESVRHFGLSREELEDLPSVLTRADELKYPLTVTLGAVAIAEDLKTGKDCDLLVAPSGSAFITSDDPAIILEEGKPVIMTVAPGFLARPEIEVYLPLKPSLACLWSKEATRQMRTVSGGEAALSNRLIWKNCYERAFASRKRDLEQL